MAVILFPYVVNETHVDSGNLFFAVNVFFNSTAALTQEGPRPPLRGPETFNVHRTLTCFVGGLVVGPGDLLNAEPNGSIPVEYLGSLVTADATIIQADIFG